MKLFFDVTPILEASCQQCSRYWTAWRQITHQKSKTEKLEI